MVNVESLFFELIQVALGNRLELSKSPSEDEWKAMFVMSQKQAVAGIAFGALEGLVQHGQQPPIDLLLDWIGLSEQIRMSSQLVSQRCQELEKIFVDEGYRFCVLKGQGTALYYKAPGYRYSGDIDLWVSKDGICKKDELRR